MIQQIFSTPANKSVGWTDPASRDPSHLLADDHNCPGSPARSPAATSHVRQQPPRSAAHTQPIPAPPETEAVHARHHGAEWHHG